MKLWNLKEISNLTKIDFCDNVYFDDISIDSRSIKKNSLFIPIKGDRFDGHDYIFEAFKNGALASFVEKKKFEKIKNKVINNRILIPVNNTLELLNDLARLSRKRARYMKMICITGSSGKTSVKDWITKILSKYFKTHSSIGNFNNQIGMPISLTRMKKETEFCILELGMNKPGEIESLTKICKPNIAIITNIGPAHIGNFASVKDIAKEKSSIFKNSENCSAIIPRDSEFFDLINQEAKKEVKNIFSFGSHKKADFQIVGSKKFNSNETEVSIRIFNKNIKVKTQNHSFHFHINLLILLSVANLIGLNPEKIKDETMFLSPTIGRGSIHKVIVNKKKGVLIDESYNSNPLSLRASLNNLNNYAENKSRKICILGDMLELGSKSNDFHEDIINDILINKIDVVFTVGQYTKSIKKMLEKESIITEHFNDLDSLYKKLTDIFSDNDIIMIKGSNSMNLNLICAKLKTKI